MTQFCLPHFCTVTAEREATTDEFLLENPGTLLPVWGTKPSCHDKQSPPLFVIRISYCLQTRIDQLQGADPGTLETKVRQYYGTDEAGDEDNTVAGHVRILHSNSKLYSN